MKQMNQKLLAQIISEEKDMLTPLVAADQAVYRESSCPNCGGLTSPVMDFDHSYTVDDEGTISPRHNRPIPRHYVRCQDCDCELDPFSGLILKPGRWKKHTPPVPIIGLNRK